MLDLRRALFSEMAMVQVGMLGVQGVALPLQPMVHLLAPALAEMWFLAEADSDLVKSVEEAAVAVYGFTGRNHDLHACLTGPVQQVPDRRGLERVWSITAEALFPGGLSNIEWMPLRVRLAEATIWASPASAVVEGMDAVLPTLREEALDAARKQVIGF